MVLLAVELPEPFLVPTIIEKSFTTLSMILLVVTCHCEGEARSNPHIIMRLLRREERSSQ
jgi:hypothetical protein